MNRADQIRVVNRCYLGMLAIVACVVAQHCAEAHAQDSNANARVTAWTKPLPATVETDRHVRGDRVAAERGRAVAWTASPALSAARTCYMEATWNRTDCNAILWTAAKRSRAKMGSPAWLSALISYSSSAASQSNAHARNAMRLPDSDLWGATSAWNARWLALRQYVARVLSGAEADSCPSAWHFGGRMDSRQGRMVPARCAGDTANTFYALARRR